MGSMTLPGFRDTRSNILLHQAGYWTGLLLVAVLAASYANSMEPSHVHPRVPRVIYDSYKSYISHKGYTSYTSYPKVIIISYISVLSVNKK